MTHIITTIEDLKPELFNKFAEQAEKGDTFKVLHGKNAKISLDFMNLLLNNTSKGKMEFVKCPFEELTTDIISFYIGSISNKLTGTIFVYTTVPMEFSYLSLLNDGQDKTYVATDNLKDLYSLRKKSSSSKTAIKRTEKKKETVITSEDETEKKKTSMNDVIFNEISKKKSASVRKEEKKENVDVIPVEEITKEEPFPLDIVKPTNEKETDVLKEELTKGTLPLDATKPDISLEEIKPAKNHSKKKKEGNPELAKFLDSIEEGLSQYTDIIEESLMEATDPIGLKVKIQWAAIRRDDTAKLSNYLLVKLDNYMKQLYSYKKQ